MVNVLQRQSHKLSYLKVSYTLSHINLIVDATCGNELLSFMDGYSGYNQITKAEKDASYMTFYADNEIYLNVLATYQRMAIKLFCQYDRGYNRGVCRLHIGKVQGGVNQQRDLE